MKVIHKSYKFKIAPDNEQKELPHLFFYQKFRGKQVVESELWISDF